MGCTDEPAVSSAEGGRLQPVRGFFTGRGHNAAPFQDKMHSHEAFHMALGLRWQKALEPPEVAGATAADSRINATGATLYAAMTKIQSPYQIVQRFQVFTGCVGALVIVPAFIYITVHFQT